MTSKQQTGQLQKPLNTKHMDFLSTYQQRFEAFYPAHLPQDKQHLGRVFDAVHHSFSAGGKRLRPALVYALADSLGINLQQVDPIALAIECIHTYSLIHDDLPAMDDDDLRRGKPACHKQFGEATAILAGDALNTFAFELLSQNSENQLNSQHRMRQILLLAQCAGIHGMVGGQDMDLYSEENPQTMDLVALSMLHGKKTGKLIEACLSMSYLAAESIDEAKLTQLAAIGKQLGLFYQIQDDILDVTQSSQVLGKPSHSDISNHKLTYVSLLGLDAAKQQSKIISHQLLSRLQQFFSDSANYQQTPLYQIIQKIIQRQH